MISVLLYGFLVLLVLALFGEFILPVSLRKVIYEKSKSFSNFFLKYEEKIYESKDVLVLEKEVKEKKWTRIQNVLARIFIFVVAFLFFVIEELFWELTFKKFFAWLEIFSFMEKLKVKIVNLDKYYILVLFLTPFILMEVLGVISLIAFSYSIFLGFFLYISKLLLFIPVKFIFNVANEKLLDIEWFKIRYENMSSILIWIKITQSYVKVHNMFKSIKNSISNWFKQDTSFIREIKVLFKTFKLWIESFSSIQKEVQEEENKQN
jgi:hypothetical protein